MSDATPTTDLGRPITIDDIKHEATGVKDLALSETKRVAHEALADDIVRTIIVGAVTVAVVASVAYYLGSRAGRVAPASPFE